MSGPLLSNGGASSGEGAPNHGVALLPLSAGTPTPPDALQYSNIHMSNIHTYYNNNILQISNNGNNHVNATRYSDFDCEGDAFDFLESELSECIPPGCPWSRQPEEEADIHEISQNNNLKNNYQVFNDKDCADESHGTTCVNYLQPGGDSEETRRDFVSTSAKQSKKQKTAR